MQDLEPLLPEVDQIIIGDDEYQCSGVELYIEKKVNAHPFLTSRRVILEFEGRGFPITNVTDDDASLVNIDFDKTLTCPSNDEWAEAHKAEPNEEMCEVVRDAYFDGAHVVIWTARQWSEASQVAGWLTAHDVPFHGLQCGKGGSDLYVDDKAVTPEEFIENGATLAEASR